MSIKVYERYGPRANIADANYPYGSIKNESVPGADDGTPLEKDWGNDYEGFTQSLLNAATITPSGSPDTVLASDRLDALIKIHGYQLTTTELITTTDLTDRDLLTTRGFYAEGDGAGAQWISTGNTIAPSQTPSDTGDGTISDVNGKEFILVSDGAIYDYLGAVGDATTDDYDVIVAGNTHAKNTFKTILLPKIYATASNITIDTGLIIKGVAIGKVNTGSSASINNCGFKSIGATDVLTVSGGAGNIIKNGELSGFGINGNYIATTLLIASTCYNTVFKDLQGSSTTGSDFAFQFDDNNGNIFLRNTIENIHYNSTGNAAATNANGFFVGSTNGSGQGCVQTNMKNCSANTVDGTGFKINGCDNNIFDSIQGFSTGSGISIDIAADGVGVGAARNNIFRSPIGNVIARTNTYGNILESVSSEVLNLTTETDSQIHFSEFDYVESSIYKTHEYKVSDYIGFGAGQFTVSGTATEVSNALSIWQALQMPDSVTSGGSLTIPNFNKLKNGKLLKVELSFVTDSVNTSANVHFRLRGEPISNGVPATVPNFDETITVPVPDAQNVTTVHEHTLSGSYGMPDDQNGYLIRLERVGGDAADTANGNVLFLAIRYYFEFDGPINGGTVQPTLPYKNF